MEKNESYLITINPHTTNTLNYGYVHDCKLLNVCPLYTCKAQ